MNKSGNGNGNGKVAHQNENSRVSVKIYGPAEVERTCASKYEHWKWSSQGGANKNNMDIDM